MGWNRASCLGLLPLFFWVMGCLWAMPVALAERDLLQDAMDHAAAGMRVQSARSKVVTENIANADTLAPEPGGDPYRRKLIVFRTKKNPRTGLAEVRVKKIVRDRHSPFRLKYQPSHPYANAEGYLVLPNVDRIIELNDAQEAKQSYEANMSALELSRAMQRNQLEILNR